MNEKTLHDLLPGPALSAEAMLTLYVPAPFGEVRAGPLMLGVRTGKLSFL